jgi:ubiquinone/menaquinone biosynthesis C-methylase UbiE
MTDDTPVDRDTAIRENQALWDEWTRVHETSEFYDLESFKRGGVRLRDYEIEEIGPVEGLDLLHLQCHFGIDTLSWARLGARVTGADLSPTAVALARRVADEIGFPEARFVQSNVYDLPAVLDGEFDVVYTSRGVLGWLPEVAGWATVVARYVRPGGRFYLNEIHPIAQALENEGVSLGELRFVSPYWEHATPLTFAVEGSYADRTADVSVTREHGWDHSLGEIVTSLIDAGLVIRSLREYPFCEWQLDFAEEGPDGKWRLPGDLDGRLPLSFSILAEKPAR